MKIPENWQEVTIEDYLEAVNYSRSIEDNDRMRVEVINALSGGVVVSVRTTAVKDLIEAWRKVAFIRSRPKDYKQSVNDRRFVGFENITLNELIVLENLFEKGFIDYMPEIIALLYRKEGQGYANMSLSREAEEVGELVAGDVIGVIDGWMDYAERLKKAKPKTFESPVPKEELNEWSEEDLAEEEARVSRLKAYGWELLLLECVKGNMSCVPDLLKMNHIQVLNMVEAKRANNIE